jgi:hypothetical protein
MMNVRMRNGSVREGTGRNGAPKLFGFGFVREGFGRLGFGDEKVILAGAGSAAAVLSNLGMYP